MAAKSKTAPKQSAKPSAQYSINDFTRNEVMPVIREVFGEWEDVGRDAAVKLIFKGLQQDGLAARRLGSKIRDKLESHLTAAVRRGIIDSQRGLYNLCLLYTSPSPRDGLLSRMPSSA